jgi:hypothetical protein
VVSVPLEVLGGPVLGKSKIILVIVENTKKKKGVKIKTQR